jgi:hypothetical protein
MAQPEKRTLANESDMAGRKIESSIDLINGDVQKAIGAGAWMLAFAGVCMALDILAKDHYFNLVFSDQHPQAEGEEVKSWAEERLFPEWDKFRKKPGSLKTIYLWALTQWGVPDADMREDIYTFRNGMVHSFDPMPFSISHEASPNKHIVNKSETGKRILHLPEFLAFEKRVRAKVMLKNGYWFDTYRFLETTTE